jgi:uncharacterized protein YndB with AHSA1/START domain
VNLEPDSPADAEDLRTIRVDEFLPHPPAKVWQTLVDPELLARWLMPNDFKPVVGHRFTFRAEPIPATGFSRVVECEVLDLRPEEQLTIGWRDADRTNTLDSTVTWRIRPEGRGTRLFLEHAGFDPDKPVEQLSRTIMNGGWRSHVLPRLTDVLLDLP